MLINHDFSGQRLRTRSLESTHPSGFQALLSRVPEPTRGNSSRFPCSRQWRILLLSRLWDISPSVSFQRERTVLGLRRHLFCAAEMSALSLFIFHPSTNSGTRLLQPLDRRNWRQTSALRRVSCGSRTTTSFWR